MIEMFFRPESEAKPCDPHAARSAHRQEVARHLVGVLLALESLPAIPIRVASVPSAFAKLSGARRRRHRA